MRFELTAVLLALSTVVPAAAGEPPADPQARCAQLPTQLWPDQHITFKAARSIGTDGCSYDGITIPLPARRLMTIENLTLGEVDFVGLYAQRIPLAFRLRVDGARNLLRTGQPVTDYMVNLNVAPFTLTTAWHWHAAEKVFRLDDLTLSGEAIGVLRLSGQLARADPARIAAVGPLLNQDVALQSAHLHLENHGFFEHYIVPFAAGALLQGARDPEAKVEELKRQAITAMRAWFAGTGTAPATVEALGAFIQSLPRPRKTLDVSIDLPRPFGIDEFVATYNGKARLIDYFPGGAVKATYSSP